MGEHERELDGVNELFAQIAEVLREEAEPLVLERPRTSRKSRASFSDLAPIVPARPPSPSSAPVPPVVVQRVHIVGQAAPSAPALPQLTYLPSVIVAEDDPPSFSVSPAAGTEPRNARTKRKVRRGARPPRAFGCSTVLFFLAISLLVCGAGFAALVYSRAADLPFEVELSGANAGTLHWK